MSGAHGTTSLTKIVALCAALVIAAVVTALAISQTWVSGAEPTDHTEFTVVGDGELPTDKPKLGDARDPLSTDETGYAIHLASTDSSIPADATNVRGKAGPQFIYADIPADVDSTGRKAVVVLYDYTGNSVYQQLVNLKTGTITSKRGTKVQPPPSPDESTAAVEIAITAKPTLTLAKQFEEVEGVPLVSPDQISYSAGSWVYDKTTTRGQECGTNRCIQLILKTSSGIYLDTTNLVVDLSAGHIVNLRGES